jgi:hypothetical protein
LDEIRLTGSSKGTLEGDGVLLDRVDSVVGDHSLAVLEDGGNVDLLPDNGDLPSAAKRRG